MRAHKSLALYLRGRERILGRVRRDYGGPIKPIRLRISGSRHWSYAKLPVKKQPFLKDGTNITSRVNNWFTEENSGGRAVPGEVNGRKVTSQSCGGRQRSLISPFWVLKRRVAVVG